MDKYEYKVRSDEINALIAEGKFAEAVKIADTIDWRRVKSVMMLCKISDLYKINRRYPESRDILLLAYEKHPTGRLIVYSLCELSIKMEEYVQAIEYYKEFVQIAPKDTGRYILQYRLYEAQDVSLEERIAVLEEFKKRDYREKWAYELAYLYHRIGLSTKCVEECDEMFLWFGEGKYVIKALELKKLHVPLNPDQQDKYDLWMQAKESAAEPFEEEPEEDTYEDTADEGYPDDGTRYDDEDAQEEMAVTEPPTTELPEVKTVDLGQYNTINLQMALAESMREILDEEESSAEAPEEEEATFFEEDEAENAGYIDSDYTGATENVEELVGEEEEEDLREPEEAAVYEDAAAEPVEYEDVTVEPAGYEDIAAEPEIYEEPEPVVQDVTAEEEPMGEDDPEELSDDAITKSLIAPLLQETIRLPDHREVERKLQETSVTQFPQRPEAGTVQEPVRSRQPEMREAQEPVRSRQSEMREAQEPVRNQRPEMQEVQEPVRSRQPAQRAVSEPVRSRRPEPAERTEQTRSRRPVMDTDNLQEISAQIVQEDTSSFDAQQILEQMKQEAARKAKEAQENRIPGARTGVLTPLNTKPSKYDNLLAQEYDGQISLVMPEAERVEKQITGQLSIEDIMAEWEEMKKTNEQKRMEDVRQRILAHTGNLFADFDEATKNGLLEELERAFVAAIMKESGRKPAIKKVILPDDTDKKRTKKAAPEPELPSEEPDEIFEEEPDETEMTEEPEDTDETVAAELPEEEPETVEEDDESEASTPETPEQHVEEVSTERELTAEEKELFGEFIHHRKTERQLVRTLDNMSLAPYTGNVLITGEEDEETLTLAKALIREMQLNDNNFSGKIAKISGTVLNKKDVAETFGRLDNGALIIENASRLRPPTTAKMAKALDKDNRGLMVLMLDKKQNINQLLAANTTLGNYFNLRVDIEALDDEALVAYAKQYAEEMEYAIDEFGVLALHTRIADMQTSDHEVNTADVRELVDEAIYHANKKTPGHFMDILLAKRYDDDDMIILREKDFMHY